MKTYRIDTSSTQGLSATPLKDLRSIQDAIHRHVPTARVESDVFAHVTSILKGVLTRGMQRGNDHDHMLKSKLVLEQEGYKAKLSAVGAASVYVLAV